MVTPAGRPQLRVVPQEGGPDAAGAPGSLDALYRRYAPYVAAVALRVLGRDDDVDDVIQDVFIDALRGASRLDNPGAIKAWLATVAVRKAMRRLRARRLRTWIGGETARAAYESIASPDASPEDRALIGRVYAVLDHVPAAARVAWTLRYVEGEKLDQVAVLCGCSLATAKRRVAAAQAILDARLGSAPPGAGGAA